MGNAADQSIESGRVEHYDADAYWRDLLSRSFNLQGVGLVGRSIAFNRWGSRARRAAVARTVPGATGLRVLDVGSGTGHWISYWHLQGAASVSGLDLTEVSVATLRSTYPEDAFAHHDAGSTRIAPDDDCART